MRVSFWLCVWVSACNVSVFVCLFCVFFCLRVFSSFSFCICAMLFVFFFVFFFLSFNPITFYLALCLIIRVQRIYMCNAPCFLLLSFVCVFYFCLPIQLLFGFVSEYPSATYMCDAHSVCVLLLSFCVYFLSLNPITFWLCVWVSECSVCVRSPSLLFVLTRCLVTTVVTRSRTLLNNTNTQNIYTGIQIQALSSTNTNTKCWLGVWWQPSSLYTFMWQIYL